MEVNKKRSAHKRVSVVVAGIAITALLLTGTYAWFSGTVTAQNVFTGTKTPKNNVVLHDDFERPIKNVYVENTGSTVVYVRVKLTEIWNLTTATVPNPAPATGWYTYHPGTGPQGWLRYDVTPADDIYQKNFIWTLGNGMKTDGSVTQANAVPFTTDYIKADGSQANNVYQSTSSQIAAMKASNPTAVGTTPVGNIVGADWYDSATFVAQYNLNFAAQIAAGTYAKLTTRADYIGWISDADGWAYWSQPLQAGQVTSLLLHEVDTVGMQDDNYYYIVNANMEAVDGPDLTAMWINGGQSVDSSPKAAQAGTFGQTALKYVAAIPVS